MFEKYKGSNVAKGLTVIAIIVVVAIAIVTSSDISNTKAQFDGLVLTDIAGKSYMLEHSSSNKFKVVEFDLVNMRAKRN